MRRKSFSNLYKSLLGSVMLAVLAVGCTNEDFDTPPVNEQDAVIITAGSALSADVEMGTRATIENTWAANDAIGITMLSSPSGGTTYYSDSKYVAKTGGNDVEFQPESEGHKMYYPIDGKEVTFKAYYPYTALADYPIYPVNVYDQSPANFAKLDLMTAVHENKDDEFSASNNKNKKEAHLKFHHRLTLVTVNLLTEDASPITLDGETELVIKGMKATGDYDLLTDVLAPDAESVRDINIPLSDSHVGQAILLPREAAEGVIFEVTLANGGVYTVSLPKDLDLNGGTKYTFNLTLKTTPTLLTASIEDWTEGPTKDYNVNHQVTIDLDKNQGFENDSQLKFYARDKDATEYSKEGTFTYDAANNKWESGTPIYWESFTGPKVDFKATSVYAGALNTSQMDDYLVGEITEVDLYSSLHMEMKHVGTKVTVKLSSRDGTYTEEDLENASVILPGYLNDGSLNDVTGEFVIGTGTGNITPEKQGEATLNERVAIFPPQTITAGNTLTRVVINGHTYNVTDASAFEYEAGTHHVITLNIEKSDIQITTEVKGWDEEEYGTEVRIGSATPGTNNGDLLNGDQLYLFTDGKEVPGYFTYNGTDWIYSGSTPLYWENIANTGLIYASITRAEVNPATGYNQSKDYITAEPFTNDGGKSNTALHLEMKHRVAKVNVKLTSSTGIYTAEQLAAAKVTLPNYKIGGTVVKGEYTTEGSTTGTITVGPLAEEGDGAQASAYLQPQDRTSGSQVVLIELGGRQYTARFTETVEYKAGYATNLTIDILPSDIKISVNVSEWGEINHNLTLVFQSTDASASGFEDEDQIKFYKLGTGSSVQGDTNYKYSGNVSNGSLVPVDGASTWYRDDFQTGDRLTAVFPANVSNLTSGNTFDWTAKSSGTTNARLDDILVAAPDATNGVIKDGANVSMHFKHVLSKVTVNLFKGTGFTDDEFNPLPGINLRNFRLSGTINVETGVATPTGNATAPFNPTQLTTPNTVEGMGQAVSSYEAFIMPQVIGTTGTKTAIVGVVLGAQTYLAEIESYDFKAGENHVFNITLNKTGLIFSATVAPWQNGTGGTIVIE